MDSLLLAIGRAVLCLGSGRSLRIAIFGFQALGETPEAASKAPLPRKVFFEYCLMVWSCLSLVSDNLFIHHRHCFFMLLSLVCRFISAPSFNLIYGLIESPSYIVFFAWSTFLSVFPFCVCLGLGVAIHLFSFSDVRVLDKVNILGLFV